MRTPSTPRQVGPSRKRPCSWRGVLRSSRYGSAGSLDRDRQERCGSARFAARTWVVKTGAAPQAIVAIQGDRPSAGRMKKLCRGGLGDLLRTRAQAGRSECHPREESGAGVPHPSGNGHPAVRGSDGPDFPNPTARRTMFDPYHHMLGLSERPVTHYQLLGLASGERNQHRIEEAALDCASRVRRYQIAYPRKRSAAERDCPGPVGPVRSPRP